MPTLSGRITVHGSKAAATATVELHNSTGDVIDQVQTDHDGRFTYHLVAGRWSLRVWDEHGHRGDAEVDLTEEDHELNLDLEEPEGGH
jgi:hypothetical protein